MRVYFIDVDNKKYFEDISIDENNNELDKDTLLLENIHYKWGADYYCDSYDNGFIVVGNDICDFTDENYNKEASNLLRKNIYGNIAIVKVNSDSMFVDMNEDFLEEFELSI